MTTTADLQTALSRCGIDLPRYGGNDISVHSPIDGAEIARLAYLPAAQLPLRQFSATVVRGHFEKHGKAEPGYGAAAIIVERVLLMRQLSPAPAVHASARYLQVGDGTQRFLVKRIDSRPDFEHIVAWTSPAQAPHGDVVAAKSGVRETPAATLQQALRKQLEKTARLRGTVYFSTEDVR